MVTAALVDWQGREVGEAAGVRSGMVGCMYHLPFNLALPLYSLTVDRVAQAETVVLVVVAVLVAQVAHRE